MGYSKEIYEAANKKLRERHRRSEEDAERCKITFYNNCPRAEEISHELASISVNTAKAVFKVMNAAEAIERLKTKALSLRSELSRLCSENNIDTLEPHYTCSKCKDTGYIDGKMCSCLKELLRKESYRRLNTLTPLSFSTFESFSLEYYSNEPQINRPSNREIMRNTLQFCITYAKNFKPGFPNLILTGGTGLGKTHLSLAIANEGIQKGYGVVYSSVGPLVTKLENEHFGHESDTEIMDSLQNCDLLILDDLGNEFRTSFSSSAIYNIVNTRILLGKTTIISTNYSTK